VKLFATLYLDEDVAVLVATLLQARGLDVTTTREQSMLGRMDREQLLYAASLQRCLVSHKRIDFELLHGEFVAEARRHCGIIIASRRNPYALAKDIAVLLNTVTADEVDNQLLYV